MTKHNGHPKHPATPAAPTAPPPPQWQPLNWSFPFAPKSGNPADPQTWLKALSNADGGFYPLGSNGMIHGGIHFDAATGGVLKQDDGVKVIADGEVVAYRLDSTYPELTYPKTPPCYALYSTGFVLVRHELVLPPAPEKAGTSSTSPSTPAGASGASSTTPAAPASGASAGGTSTPQAYQPPADEVMEFYSLYMHQLDWAGYKAAEASGSGQAASPIHSLPFWEGDKHYRVGSKANDRQAQPPQLNTPFRFDLNSTNADSAGEFENCLPLDSVAAGPSPGSLEALTWQSKPTLRYALPSGDAGNTASAPESAQGVRILDRVKGTVIGLLPRGGELGVTGTATSGWAQIATIISGTPVAAVAGGTPDPRAATGWVNLDELDTVVDPKPLDTVVVLDKPYPVKAGDVVGYLGEYENSTHAQILPPQPMRPMLHVEVFTGVQIKDFISKSQDRAKQLPDSGKTMLVIQQGAQLVKPADPQNIPTVIGKTLVPAKGDPGKGNWAKVQPTEYPTQAAAHSHGQGHAHHASHPTGTPVGKPVWVERKFAGKAATSMVRTWTDFPLLLANAKSAAVGYQQVFSRAQLDQLFDSGKAVDEQGTQWWSITAGDADGNTISGWVCEKNHPNTEWQSPWSWPGFDTVDTTSVPLLDMYRRNLYEVKQLLDGEEEEFRVVAATVNAGLLIGKLEQAAKRQGSGKGNVIPADLKNALNVPWLAEAVSHLIVRYESEWGGDMSKWEKLLSIMGDAGKPIWKTEMERIKKLQWWDQAKAVKGYPSDPEVWHIHPIGLAGNFFNNTDTAHTLILTSKDVLDLKKTLQTEWVQFAGDMQAKGVIDTILNRVASGQLGPNHHFGSTVSEVVNQYNQFSDISGPIARNQHGRSSVEQIPVSSISQRVNDIVDSYLRERANGAESSVGTNLNYANPFFSSPSNLPWINALSGPRYGTGNAIHYHGTTPGLEKYRPEPYRISLSSGT
ncbi:cell wall hydrolase [Paraburkholderia acidipaludis]|uniref:cell wall hydrolase n=1 Tax=Paraburkholderia acidipaludis TaxID=660537 RepID=UPI0004853B73|nr:cell wall hydrolase [Paraburkholderia acidipaludis]